MTLARGTHLGPYEISAKLGEGGMGVVYRARDTRLDREVALKFLPAGFADDPERHARFEREAKVLASLNHPNIAALYGLEHLDGQHALVMELVEGEGLDERIARGPIPVDEALPIAVQIAEALEAAHERGIVHRDLKPANVKVRPDGTVKVLDFGLAKAWEEQAAESDPAHSPTITGHHTRAGVILGTAAYMSPEQARGKPVDRRADIWAFGCVLYEMLTGRRLFEGETVSDVLAAVLRTEPDWNLLPPTLPPSVRRLLGRCLERDPRQRLRDIGDARLDLEDAMAQPAQCRARPRSDAVRKGTPGRRWLLWASLPAALAAGVAAGVLFPRGGPARAVVISSLMPPAGAEYYLGGKQPGPVSVSPDGTRIAFAARDEAHGVLLWVRNLGSPNAVPLTGTENGSYPFWSPDGRSIGFFADGKLKRVDAAGGTPLALADAPFGKGGTWSAAGTILFAPSYNSAILRIPAQGGTPRPVTSLDRGHNQNSHRFPWFLPDGRHFLFLARVSGDSGRPANEVMVGSLDGGEPRPLVATDNNAAYASGFLLYTRERVLMARRFDPARLRVEGDESAVASDVAVLPGAACAVFSVSRTGVLVYDRGTAGELEELVWLDRQGRRTGTLGPPGFYDEPRLSPDGRQVAVDKLDATTGRQDVWVVDTARGIPTRLTTAESDSMGPVWLPDSRHLVFRTHAGGFLDLFERALGGRGGNTLLLTSDSDKEATSVSPDGRFLAFRSATSATGFDIWMLPLNGNGRPFPFLHSRFNENNARFSPDGRAVAYVSDESGRNEVYVVSFPDAAGKVRVSAEGGRMPDWSGDGKELFFLTADGSALMAAPVTRRARTSRSARPARLFQVPFRNSVAYDTWRGRFLFTAEQDTIQRSPLTLVQGWTGIPDKATTR